MITEGSLEIGVCIAASFEVATNHSRKFDPLSSTFAIYHHHTIHRYKKEIVASTISLPDT